MDCQAALTPVRSALRASGHAPQPTRTPVGRAGNRRGRNRPSNRPGELRSCPHPRPHPPRFRAPSRRTCRATFASISPIPLFAPTAAAHSSHWAKTLRSCWSMFPPLFASSVTFGPSTPAAAATGSSRRRHRRDRSPADWPVPVFWPMCWSRNIPITCRSIGNPRFTRVPGSICPVRPWPGL